jgi:hypothetical protein
VNVPGYGVTSYPAKVVDGKLLVAFVRGDLTMLNDKITRIKESSVAEGKKLFWIFAYLWLLLGLFSVSLLTSHPAGW